MKLKDFGEAFIRSRKGSLFKKHHRKKVIMKVDEKELKKARKRK